MDELIEDTDQGPLFQALELVANGDPIPMDLAVELMGLGYDVGAIERMYL